MMPASTPKSSSQVLSVLLVVSMLAGAFPLSLVAMPAAGAQEDGGSRGILPSEETFTSVNYRSLDSDNNSRRDAIEVRYTVRTGSVSEQVSVLIKVEDSDGNTVKARYDNFTAFLFGNQERSWTFYAYYTGRYRMVLTLYDSQGRQEDTDTSGFYALDTGVVKRWITIETRSLDLDKDTYKDDVEVHVTNWTGKDVDGAQVWINGTQAGKTNATGVVVGKNYDKGWKSIDVFWKDLHNSTAWYSEGDGSSTGGLSVRAEVMDFDDDGLEDDVIITVRNQLGFAVRGASVTINGTDYGTTDAQGQVTAFNFRKGFWVVNVTRLNAFGSTTFYSEGQGPGSELDEYFYDIEVAVVDHHGDDRENDLRLRFDVDVDPPVRTNVTVWANITHTNFTAYLNVSTNFSVVGTETAWHTVHVDNITYGVYYIWFTLLDEYNNTEDWDFATVRLTRPSNHINIETGVHYQNPDFVMNDVLFRAFRVDEGTPNITITMFNSTGAQVRRAKTDDVGRRWFNNLADGEYNWTAKDADGHLIERGRVVIGTRVQVETDLLDSDFDGFFDDFRVRAYNNADRGVNTVTVTVWAPNGTRVTSNRTLGGERLALNLTKGTYEFNATYLGSELVNGTFYSYGNVDEEFTILVQPRAVDLDGDGRFDDLNISVVDNDDSPMEFASVYVDGVYQTLTDLGGSAEVKDLSWGIHTVEARYSGEVAKGLFFSEGTTAHTAAWTVLYLAPVENALDALEAEGGSSNDTIVLYYCERTERRPRAAHLWLVLDGMSQEIDLSRLGRALTPGEENPLEDPGVLEAVFKFSFGTFKALRTAAIFPSNPTFDGPYQFEQNLTSAVGAVGSRVGLVSYRAYPTFASFAYEIRSSFEYVMTFMGLSGFPLIKAVNRVVGQPSTTTRELGELLVDEYTGSQRDRTLLLDMSKVGTFATRVDDLATDLASAYPGEGWAIQDARNASGFNVADFDPQSAVHAADLADELATTLSGTGLRTRAVAMRDAARAVVVKQGSSGFDMALLFPNETEEWEEFQEYFPASSLATDTHWDEFMAEFWRFRDYGVSVNATPYDAESSGRKNDVLVYVNDTYGRAIAGASVHIDRVYEGLTDSSGELQAFNYTRGIHLVNVTWRGYEAEASFTSEGTIVPNQPPSVTITTPEEDEEVNGTYSITGTSDDPDGFVSYVEVRIDGGTWQRAVGRVNWRYDWDTTEVDDGDHRIDARSYDGDLYSPVVSVNITVYNPVVYAEVLVVDDDGGDAYETWFTQALVANGREYDIITVPRNGDGPAADRLLEAKYVIWLTGETSTNTLRTADIAALRTFLDAGGALWLTGQDIGKDLTSDGTVTSAFMRDYLKADYVADNADDYDLIGVVGEDISNGINISIEGGTGARNQNFPSEVQPRPGAAAVYLYNNTAEAAVKFGSAAFRTVYFAFGFEAVSTVTDRNRVLEAVLDWLASNETTSDNLPPVVSAGNDITVTEGEVAILRGTASDPDGLVARFEWDVDGDGTYDWSNTTTGVLQWLYETAGNYTATLKATDNVGDFATDSVSVEVRPKPPNQPPVADAGEDVEVEHGDPVEFLMAGNDVDGTVVLYEWDYDGDGTYDEASAVAITTSYIYYDAGVYMATLRVTDDDGATGTDVRQVTVKEKVQNKLPTADAGPDLEVEVDRPVTLVGKGTDPDGTIVTYKWDFDGDGTYDFTSPTSGTTTHVYEAVGVFTARLLVFDNDGGAATDTTNVTVTPVHVNQPPVADAGPDGTVEAAQFEDVEFHGTGTDADGFIVKYEWDFDGEGTWDWTSDQERTVTYAYQLSGLFVARFRVTDNEGATDVDTLRVSVQAAVFPNDPPTAEAGGPYDGLAGQMITLTGTGSDPDGSVVSYEWDFEGDGTLDNYNPSSGIATVSYQRSGEYTAVLYVTDDRGAVATDTAQVTILRANAPPTVRIVEPASGALLKGYQVFRGTATDDTGVAKVEVRIDDGAWVKATGTSSWTYDVDVSKLIEGVHTLRVRATDLDGAVSSVADVQFQSVPSGDEEEDEPGTPAWVWISIIVVIAAVLVVVAAVMMRPGKV